MSDHNDEPSPEELRHLADEPPIVRVVNLIISQAINDGATAVHIEQNASEGRVRFRVDGRLHGVMEPPKQIFPALVARLKIMALMDIAERRIAQEGLLHLTHEARNFQVRVSSMPGHFGEKIVLRLQKADPADLADFDLTRLGMSPANQQRLRALLNRPHGLCLVGGWRRSGTSTLLYACLTHLNEEGRGLVSIEDEVELQLPWVHQVTVNSRVGLTRATALRSFLRQDPDVMMVGILHDGESARYALEAALSRHLVLAGCYCDEAAQSLRRLLQMHLDPFLVASGVTGSVSVRLARRLCPHCREAYQPSEGTLAVLGLPHGPLYRAPGCDQCRQTGILGQVGLHEVLCPNDTQREVLLRDGSLGDLRRAHSPDFVSLRQDAQSKLQTGLISPEEFVRIVDDYPTQW